MGVKIVALTIGGLVLLALISLSPFLKINAQIIPEQVLAKTFFFVALFLMVSALAVLLRAARLGGQWEVPTETAKLAALGEKDERKYVEYVSARYVMCLENNAKRIVSGIVTTLFPYAGAW